MISPDVQAINRDQAVALMDDGALVPITDWLDAFGEACKAADAVVAVAGPLPSGKWVSIDLSAFVPTNSN